MRRLLAIVPILLAILLATAAVWVCFISHRLVILAIVLAAGAGVLLVDYFDKRAARRQAARNRPVLPSPRWAVSLLVDADEKSAIMRPAVQLLGPKLPNEIEVDLRVGGRRGAVELTTKRRFTVPATGTDLLLGPLVLPHGLSTAEAAGRNWTVVVSNNGHEIARRRGPLTAALCLNEEAELQAPDLEAEPRTAKPSPPTPTPVRNWAATTVLGLLGTGCAVGGYLLLAVSAWLWFASAPLFVLAALFLLAAALFLNVRCPRCGRPTTVVGRTAAQQCDACRGRFTLRPGPL